MGAVITVIEYKAKIFNRFFRLSNEWRMLDHYITLIDINFEHYKVRVDGTVYTEWSTELELIWQESLTWHLLKI